MSVRVRPAELRFDGWTLLRASGELLRDGRRIRLQDHPCIILEALLARPGELVTREELIALLWPNQVVDFDTALNTSVRRLRAALGDEADTPRYIETVPRRGYRFIGRLEAPPAPAVPIPRPVSNPPPTPRRRLAAQAVAAIALAGLAAAAFVPWRSPRQADPQASLVATPHRVVVLPFVDLAADGDSRLFADGLTEELINRLAQLEGTQVIARTSSFAYRDRDADIATVARELGVSHVLEGSVRGAGDRLRVTAQLIDARTSTHLWSTNYDRKSGDLFDIQDDIATQVATALEVALDPQSAAARHPDPAAYAKFLVGRHLFQRRAPGDMPRAIAHFEESIAIDPGFARAWSGLASAYMIAVAQGEIGRSEGLARLEPVALRAIELDPRLAEPYVRLAHRAWWLGNHEESRRLWQKAIELEPDDPLVLSASVSRAKDAGRTEEAIALMRRIVTLDPLVAVYRHNLAVELYRLGRHEEAVAEERMTAALIATHKRTVECSSLVMLGRFAEARAVATATPDAADKLRCRSLAEHGLGSPAESAAALAALIADHGETRQLEIAEVHGFRGEKSAAFEWLRRNRERCANDDRHTPTCVEDGIRLSPLLSSLHDDPRWVEYQDPT
jgi:TolB-like protein/DNA-binding winged helix-turn-helix (wHTH) protein/tetratricopeptide (TPR) repeat protein